MTQQGEAQTGRESATRKFQQPSDEQRAMTTNNSHTRDGGTQSSSEAADSYSIQRWQGQTFKEDPWHEFQAEGGTANYGSPKRMAGKAVSTSRNDSMVAKAGSDSTRT